MGFNNKRDVTSKSTILSSTRRNIIIEIHLGGLATISPTFRNSFHLSFTIHKWVTNNPLGIWLRRMEEASGGEIQHLYNSLLDKDFQNLHRGIFSINLSQIPKG